MIVRTLLAALVAGLIAGVVMTAAQQIRVVPLIIHAEQFEGMEPGAAHEHSAHEIAPLGDRLASAFGVLTPALAHGDGAHGADADEGGILFGMNRYAGSLLANLVTGAGFALLLTAVALLAGQAITVANGVAWGACGWLAVQLLPAIGLPPELPGFPAASLGDRQAWWMATVAASAAGVGLLALRGEMWAKALGVVLIAAPHVVGAPQPDTLESAVPAVLAAEYAVAALATTLLFWIVLGLGLGYANQRVAAMEEPQTAAG